MRLKQIELQGFKSFPDKTKIAFPDGLTVIIGPNGSGKSNISDAVRWVLGEMSLKTLRGSKMEDVIFNGTPKRPAANYTYVSLYLDTSAEHDAAPAADGQAADRIRLSDEPEFVITRRYYRTGESEYYINKKQVRLKDIYELFYDTGIGREGYSVIGQGKISEVLSVKGDERRSIFEEAAGISKYRFRKTEAERKLRDTETNLVRINDILGELSARVGPLEKEAENAKKYLALSDEKKGLEITVWLERTDKIRSELGERERSLASAKLELDLAEEEIKRLSDEEEKSAEYGYDIMRRRTGNDEAIAENEGAISASAGRRAVTENEQKHTDERSESLERDKASCVSELEDATKAEAEAQAALNEAESKTGAAGETLKKLTDRYNTAVYAHNENVRAGEESQSLAEELSRRYAEQNAECAALRARLEATSDGSDSAKLTASRERADELSKLLEEARTALDGCISQAEAVKASVREAEEAIRAASAEKAGIDEKISAGKIKAASLEEQREGLIRLDRLFEGYSGAVKTVMTSASDGRITADGGAVDIRGTVASLLSTDGEYVVALETALGASVQFVVVGREADAKACMAFLKRTGGGRATFLPLDTVKGRKSDVSAIRGLPGYIGIASELAQCDAEYSGIADELLGRTVIASDIDAASVLARKSGYRVRIVTKDGQVINAGGSYTGGSPAQKVGVFTRGVDIERLDREIKDANLALFELETQKRRSQNAVDAAQNDVFEKEKELDELTVLTDEARSRLAGIAARHDEEAKKLSELEEAEKDYARDRDAGTEKLTLLGDEMKELSARAEAEKKKSAELRAQTAALRMAESDALERLNAFRVEEVRTAAAADNAKARLDDASARRQSVESRLASLAVEAEANEDKKNTLAAALKAEYDLSATLESKGKELIAERDRLAAEYEEREKADAERRSDMRAATIRRDQAFKSHASLESGVESQHMEYDLLLNRLWDEYELTYTDAERFRLPAENTVKAQTRINYLKNQIKALGTINVNAVAEYAETKQRYDFLNAQVEDLNKTRRSLDSAIAKLNGTMRATFTDTIAAIDTAFSEVFAELFGGGQGHIELQDPETPLECGIDIIIRPPGKSVKSISLLSGGEQSFAAIALYLALQRINPSPFCIFDEIESALDDVNLVRFVDYVRQRCDKTQYIMITHRRGTMERADTLYGVTMHEKGVSDYIRLDISKIEKYTDKE